MPKFKATPHPILPVPTAKQAAAMGEQRWRETLRRREEIIARERRDPLRHGWEPPVWQIPDALLGWPWLDQEKCAAWREALGFKDRVKVVFILGGNRGAKTEYAAKRCSRMLHHKDGAIVWPFHSTANMSVETHHKLMWKFIPPEIPNFEKGEITYISYKQKTGFSDAKFVLPNRSECAFKNYSMEKDDALQGPEIDVAWPDELVPPDWVEDLLIRLATRGGRMVVTFTPVQGYTATVKMVQDGAETVLEEVAYLWPKDEGDPDEARALGFDDEEMMRRSHALGIPCRPTGFDVAEGKVRVRQPAVPAGRRFHMMPRVMRCVDPNYAIVFFYSSDNPYGRPDNLAVTLREKSRPYVRERWYGFANKTVSCRFPKFNLKVHTVRRDAIPAAGTNYMLMDPARARNFVMKWYRVTKEGKFLYREWPSYYEVPGVGVPGAWALPDAKKLDGRPGPAQTPFGWGLLRYKQEIARLEGWKDAVAGVSEEKAKELLKKRQERARRTGGNVERDPGAEVELGVGQRYRTLVERDVERWTPDRGAAEQVFERFMDSRAASAPRIVKDVPRTLQTDFLDIGLDFRLAPGESIDEGVAMINDALDYEEELELDYFNRPDFYVCDECRNSIFALQTWTGADGQKGACKDFVDLDRYFFLLDLEYVEAGALWETSGGGYY